MRTIFTNGPCSNNRQDTWYITTTNMINSYEAMHDSKPKQVTSKDENSLQDNKYGSGSMKRGDRIRNWDRNGNQARSFVAGTPQPSWSTDRTENAARY